jgi:hypothetical protein
MSIQDFFYSIMIKKGVRTLVKVVISFVVSVKVTAFLQSIGVTVDPTTMEAGLTATFASLIEMLRNYLKQKHGVKNI